MLPHPHPHHCHHNHDDDDGDDADDHDDVDYLPPASSVVVEGVHPVPSVH